MALAGGYRQVAGGRWYWSHESGATQAETNIHLSMMSALNIYTVLMRTNSPKQPGCLQVYTLFTECSTHTYTALVIFIDISDMMRRNDTYSQLWVNFGTRNCQNVAKIAMRKRYWWPQGPLCKINQRISPNNNTTNSPFRVTQWGSPVPWCPQIGGHGSMSSRAVRHGRGLESADPPPPPSLSLSTTVHAMIHEQNYRRVSTF